MDQYRNKNRLGTRTSTTIDPKLVAQDFTKTIKNLSPFATPLQTLSGKIGRGPKPKAHKIQVMQYHEFDNYDYCSAVTLGTAADGTERYARLTLDQPSRPDLQSSMYYQPQEKFFIVETQQVVEVVVTPNAAIQLEENTDFTFPNTNLTGNTTSRSQSGTVVVRNVNPYPVAPFTTSHVVYLGRTIHESQRITATGAQRDFVWDCNFVEHKEKVLTMTEDQKKWVMTENSVPDWTFQQQEMMKEFKLEVEFNALFSEREIDMATTDRPTRHMRGLYHAIRTNIASYNPASITDFELMFSNFLYEMGFRYNPNGYNKIVLGGGRFLHDFNLAFREYRRTTDLKLPKEIALDAETYKLPGGMAVTILRTDALQQKTKLENWAFVIDPALAKWRIVKDYESRMYANNDERDIKLMCEWQGSIAWELEQAHALLKTN